MTHDERRLIRHLTTAVVVKLGALLALWWLFAHDGSVHVDPERAAAHIGAFAASAGDTP